MRKTIIATALVAAAAGALPAVAQAQVRCVNPRTNATTGALVGAAGGAAVGSVLAGRNDRGKGAVLGALGGALLGGAVGNQQTRCPEGYYAYDDRTRQYYDNSGAVYDPGHGAAPGYAPAPVAGAGYDPGHSGAPGYAPPPPGGAGYGAPPPPPGAYGRGPGYGGPGYGRPGYAGGGVDYYGGAPTDLMARFDWTQRRIDRAAGSGRLNPREADNAYADLRDIRMQYRRLTQRGGGGLNGADRQYINDRLNTLARNVRWESRDAY